MFSSVLTVCQGNICRSPLAAFMLADSLPAMTVGSAGLTPLEGHDMAPDMRALAEEKGHQWPEHEACKLTLELCQQFDLILVMEQRHRDEIRMCYPQVSGKVFLLSHWNGGKDIADPWKKSHDVYVHAYEAIEQAVSAWLPKLQ